MNCDVSFQSQKTKQKKDTTTQHCKFALKHAFLTYLVIGLFWFLQWNSSFVMGKKDGSNAFSFFAKTEDMKAKWIDAIKLAL